FPSRRSSDLNNYESSTWFIGYTSDLSTPSWVGNYQGIGSEHTLRGLTIGGRYFEDAWGSLVAGPMWVDYMKVAGPNYDTEQYPEFDKPTGNPRTMEYSGGGSSNNDSSSDSYSDSDEDDASEESTQQSHDESSEDED